jgi:DNA repair protein RadA/Sms
MSFYSDRNHARINQRLLKVRQIGLTVKSFTEVLFMPKAPKSIYVCTACGYETPRWLGKCPGCGAWNTLEEHMPEPVLPAAKGAARPIPKANAVAPLLRDIGGEDAERTATGMEEFDRVLGGGIVDGSLVLLGGDPGVGKSTLLLQTSGLLAAAGKRVLYATGEESLRQIAMRARRLGVERGAIHALAETDIGQILAQIEALQPDYLIVDSIQTVYQPAMSSAAGSVSQVRECASALMRAAKQTGCAVFLVGHVTKEGALAGPKVLEHMVDAVLYFEGDRLKQYRILRAAKNRFGSINEIGIFDMRENGMREVPNPSEFLLSGRRANEAGSAVACAMEGTRPVLCDLQALVSPTSANYPRRQTYGFDHNRTALLLAVLEKRAGLPLYNQDVYVNVAGGLELSEPAADLPLLAAVFSSVRAQALPADWVIVGEVGLTGEVRAVSQMERRLSECAHMGFSTCVLPQANLRGLKPPDGLHLIGVETVTQALSAMTKAGR